MSEDKATGDAPDDAKPFAKLFDVDGRQVLVYHGSDDDESVPNFLHMATTTNGTRMTVHHRWPDTDEGADLMLAAFDRFAMGDAIEFVSLARKASGP